jgi:uncharacterized protein (DUF2267 family)
MKYDEFLRAVATRAGVPQDEAAVITEAVLETLAERISGGEARDLAAQLPGPLQRPLQDAAEPAEPFELDEFVGRVADRADLEPEEALEATRAVLATVREAVTGGEFEDVLSQLPREFTDLIEPVSRRR